MKKTLAVFLLAGLLAGCLWGCGGTQKVDTLPGNAVVVFQQEFEGQTGANVAHGNWDGDGEGYFIVAVNFTKGSFKTMEIYDGNNNNAVLLALQKADNSGMYQTQAADMSEGHYGMRFRDLKNAKGTITVYFVADSI